MLSKTALEAGVAALLAAPANAPEQAVLAVWQAVSAAVLAEDPNRLRTLLRNTAEKHGITVADMVSKSQTRPLVMARAEFCHTAYSILDSNGRPRYSSVLLGQWINRDHTTVLYLVRRWQSVLSAAIV